MSDMPRPNQPQQSGDSRPQGGPGRPQSGPGGPRKRFSKPPFMKKKVCKFCAEKVEIDYKQPNMLKGFTSERGKILSSRITGVCSKHQRKLTQAIKRARMLAMIAFTAADA